MGKIILWLCGALFAVSVFAQGNTEIVIPHDREFIYPDLVLFAYSSKPQIVLEITNNRLVIKNPHSTDNAPLQVITLDGKVHNFIIKPISTEMKRRIRQITDKRKVASSKITKISFKKKYSESKAGQGNSLKRASVFDSTSLIINSRINKETSFLGQVAHMKRMYSKSTFEQLNYFLRVNYLNYFAEYGMMNMRKKTVKDMGGHGGRVLGTRLGYNDREWAAEIFKGKSFFGTNTARTQPEESDLQGAALFYTYNNLQNFGVSFFENVDSSQNITTFESKGTVNKVKFSGNYSLHNNNTFGQSSHYSWQTEYLYSTKKALSLRNVGIGNTVYNPGFNGLVYDDFSTITSERWNGYVNFNLLVDSNQALTLSTSHNKSLSSVNEINTYNFGLNYSYSNLSARLLYDTSSAFSNVDGTTRTFVSYSPQINIALTPSNARRQQSIGLNSRFLTSREQNYKNNTFNLSYRNSSAGDSHGLTLSRQTSESDARVNNLYNASYSFTKIYDTLRFGPGVFYTFSNFRSQDPNIYLTDRYGYKLFATYAIKPHHFLGADFSEAVSLRRDPHTKVQNYSLSYNFNFGADIQTPVARLFNHRSFKAHFFKDYNFNGKLDSGEPLISDLKISLLNENGELLESKKTDKDGYVSFSWLAKGQYQIKAENEEFYSNNDRWVDLTDSSLTKEVPLAEARTIVLKIFDLTTQKFVTGALSFDIKCPSINYSRNVRLDNLESLTVGIPTVECTVSPNFLQYNNVFEGIDTAPRTVTKSEIIFNIRQINKIEFIFSVLDSERRAIPYTGKDLRIRFNGQVYYPNGDFLSIELPWGENRYSLEDIVEGPYKCQDAQSSKPEFITLKDFFLKRQVHFVCQKR